MAVTTESVEEDLSLREFPKSFTKFRIIKNVTLIAFGFVLLFTAYTGISMLQSTINQDEGIGVASQAITYACFCVSTLLLPKYMIRKLGLRRSLWISMIAYIPYIAANFYPHWITMVPSAMLVGLAASILWGSQCTYYNQASVLYSELITPSTERNKDKNPSSNSSNRHCALERNNSYHQGQSSFENRDAHNQQNKGVRMQFKMSMEKTEHNDLKPINTISSSVKNDNEIAELHQYPKVVNSINEYKYLPKESKSNTPQNTASSLPCSEDICNHQNEAQVCNEINTELSKTIESVTARFFGLYGLVFCSNHVWSNLISFYVLQKDIKTSNITFNSTCTCGASFCNEESQFSNENLAEPSDEMRYMLTGIFVAIGIVGALLLFAFLDDLNTEKVHVKFSLDMLMATCKFIKRREQIFLIPLTMYIGLSQGFYIGDYTKSYIACVWGAYHVGLVTICFGLASAFSSMMSGWIVKYVGRIPIFLTTAFINKANIAFLLMWNPDPDRPLLLFLGATAWGIIVGAFWSQLRAFYGVLFKKNEEAAFGGFYLWDSIGFCLAFSISNNVCTYIKLYVLLAVSCLGILGYLIVESSHSSRKP